MRTGRMQTTTNDFLSEYDKGFLNELAGSIADFYCPRGVVNPEVIAEKCKISYNYSEYGDSYDGLIEHLNGKFHIFINIERLQHAFSDRARFTFAHELGHYFIDTHRNSLLQGMSPSHGSFTGFVRKNRAERQADYFASCLLLPEERFVKDCNRRKFSFKILQELSKKYQVSISATSLRFCAIGNHPIMVVYSFKGKIKWHWNSNDFPYWKLKHGKEKLPEDTVAGEYFQLFRKPLTTQTVFAMDWFDNVWDSHTHRKFYEHCICQQDHALSIIWED
ncbi:MAG: ImmA/IrrE family metallo-endopeptidase [Flavobacteriaceae bacterium]